MENNRGYQVIIHVRRNLKPNTDVDRSKVSFAAHITYKIRNEQKYVEIFYSCHIFTIFAGRG